MLTSKTESAFGLLHITAEDSDCLSWTCTGYLPFCVWTLTDSLPACTALEYGSTSLRRSKSSLSLVTHCLKEPLFVGRRGRKKSGAADCFVGNSCQDRKTSVSERKRRRKPHNQDLYCGLWPGQNPS